MVSEELLVVPLLVLHLSIELQRMQQNFLQDSEAVPDVLARRHEMAVVETAVILFLRHPDHILIEDVERRMGGKPEKVRTSKDEAVVTIERWLHKFGQRGKWNFCLTTGTLMPANQERR